MAALPLLLPSMPAQPVGFLPAEKYCGRSESCQTVVVFFLSLRVERLNCPQYLSNRVTIKVQILCWVFSIFTTILLWVNLIIQNKKGFLRPPLKNFNVLAYTSSSSLELNSEHFSFSSFVCSTSRSPVSFLSTTTNKLKICAIFSKKKIFFLFVFCLKTLQI